MAFHGQHISAFIRAVQTDDTITEAEKGRELYEAIDFLEEVLANYPDPRTEGADDDDY